MCEMTDSQCSSVSSDLSGNNFCLAIGSEKCSGETAVDRYWISKRKSGDQTQNPAIFDHVNLKNMYVMLNSTRYPAVDYNLSFANQQFSRAYSDASLFGIRYFAVDELTTRSNISQSSSVRCARRLSTSILMKWWHPHHSWRLASDCWAVSEALELSPLLWCPWWKARFL